MSRVEDLCETAPAGFLLKLDPGAQGQRPRFGLVRKRTQRSLTQVWSEKDIVPSLSRLLKLVTMDSLEGWGTPETDCQSLYLYAYVLFTPQRGSISFNRFQQFGQTWWPVQSHRYVQEKKKLTGSTVRIQLGFYGV